MLQASSERYIVKDATDPYDYWIAKYSVNSFKVVKAGVCDQDGLLRNQYKAAHMLICCLYHRKSCLKVINSLSEAVSP